MQCNPFNVFDLPSYVVLPEDRDCVAGRVSRRMQKGRALPTVAKKQAIPAKQLGITVDASPKDSALAAPFAESISHPVHPEKQQCPVEQAANDKAVARAEEETLTPIAPKVRWKSLVSSIPHCRGSHQGP